MKNFGMDLKRALDSHGIGASELAKTAGVTPNAVARWLKNEAFPRPDKWRSIELVAEISPQAYVDYGDTTTSTATATNQSVAISNSPKTNIGQREQEERGFSVDMTENEYFLWMVYRRIPEEKRQEVLSSCQSRLMRVVSQLTGA